MTEMQAKIVENETVRRTVRLTSGGFVRIDQFYNVRDAGTGTDVTGKYWILGLVRVHSGSIRFRSGDEWVSPPSNPFVMFVPPYQLIEAELSELKSENQGIAWSKPLPAFAPKDAVVFVPPFHACPETVDELHKMIKGASAERVISRAPKASAISRRIKRSLDLSYMDSCKISNIAAQLRIRPNVLTKHFRNTYGMTPVNYRHWLRVMDAMMQLMEGKAIVDVAQDVGFEDLSRFYKQFKKIASGPPAKYRTPRKGEKTPRRARRQVR